jgi:hypothetical protein
LLIEKETTTPETLKEASVIFGVELECAGLDFDEPWSLEV